MYRLNRLLRISSKGFTLLESIIVMGVLSIAMVVIFYAFTATMRLLTDEFGEADVTAETHRTVERMVKELRNTREIVTATSESITFWLEDLNGNSTRDANETVQYYWDASREALYRQTAGVNLRLSNNINNFTLTFDNPVFIRSVNIHITAKKGNVTGTLESAVKSRNL